MTRPTQRCPADLFLLQDHIEMTIANIKDAFERKGRCQEQQISQITLGHPVELRGAGGSEGRFDGGGEGAVDRAGGPVRG